LTLYPTAEVLKQEDFPHFGIIRRRVVTSDTDAGLTIEYTLTGLLEVSAKITTTTTVSSPEVLQLQQDVDNYTLALESMVLNWEGDGAHYRSVTSSEPLEGLIGDADALFKVQMQIILKFLE